MQANKSQCMHATRGGAPGPPGR
eukprot:COSAG01_NODE_67968_length_265_cov_0.939759_1_plen_22_part_10